MDQPEKRNSDHPKVPLAASTALGAQVGCVTLLIVFAALAGGLWLDKQLDSKPMFTIVFVLGSAPLALFLTFWMAMRQIRDMQSNQQPSKGGKPQIQDDDKEDQ